MPPNPIITSPEHWSEYFEISEARTELSPLPNGWRFYRMFLFQPNRLARWFGEAVEPIKAGYWSVADLRLGPKIWSHVIRNPKSRPDRLEFPSDLLGPLIRHLIFLFTLPMVLLGSLFLLLPQSVSPAFLAICATLATFLFFVMLGTQRIVLVIPGAVLSFAPLWLTLGDSCWNGWHFTAAFAVWTAAGTVGALAAVKLSAFSAVEYAWTLLATGAMGALSQLFPGHLISWAIIFIVLGMVTGSASMICDHRGVEWLRIFSLGAFIALSGKPVSWLSGQALPPEEWLWILLGCFILGNARWLETLAINLIQFILYLLQRGFGVNTLRYSPILFHDAHGETRILPRHLCFAPEDPSFNRILQACYASIDNRTNYLRTRRMLAPDVFISYNTKDREPVQKLAQGLESAGLSVWVDTNSLRFGEPRWEARLADGLFFSNVFVICLGPEGLGPWQQKEYDLSLEIRKWKIWTHLKSRKMGNWTLPIISIVLPQATEPPEEFQSFPCINLRQQDRYDTSLFARAVDQIASEAEASKAKSL